MKKPYIAQVLPLKISNDTHEMLIDSEVSGALMLLTDQELESKPSIDVLEKLFGLTPTESLFSLHLVEGDSVKDIAEKLNVREGTARWHLKNIQTKTETRRQADLVRVLSNIPTIQNSL